MHLVATIFAAFVASASFVSAECQHSAICALPESACSRLCEMRGHPSGGVCAHRDGCPNDYYVCSCHPVKRSDELIDGDALLEEGLAGDITPEEFVNAVLKEDVESEDEGQVEERGLDKRSICCSLVSPFAGLCCEQSCYHAGHLEGGQCSANNVCTCG